MIIPDADSAHATVAAIIRRLDAWRSAHTKADAEAELEAMDALIRASHENGRSWGAHVSAEARDMANGMPMARGY